MDTEWITGYRQFVLVDAKLIPEQIVEHNGQTCLTISYMSRTVVRSNWFDYCIIV